MDKILTDNQNIVLESLKGYFSKNGKMPTIVELKRYISENSVLKLTSDNSVLQYLKVLEKKGFIERFKKARGIRLLEKTLDNVAEVPLIGIGSCGEALCYADRMLDEIADDYFSVSKKYIEKDKEKEYFLIKASGDSLDKLDIRSGDLLLIRKYANTEPQNGDIAVVVINSLTTIKRYKKNNDGSVVLIPESNNSIHKPIILHEEDDIIVCGKVEHNFNNLNEFNN